MKIGVPKEIKTLEFRVGLVPPVVHQLTVYGHQVFVETGAGAGIGQSDEDYKKAGATILPNADEIFKAADMIVKVKEPQAVEIARLKPNHILFTYLLHLAPDPEQAKGFDEIGRHRHRLRNAHHHCQGPPAVAGAAMAPTAGHHRRRKLARHFCSSRPVGAACCSAVCLGWLPPKC